MCVHICVYVCDVGVYLRVMSMCPCGYVRSGLCVPMYMPVSLWVCVWICLVFVCMPMCLCESLWARGMNPARPCPPVAHKET